MPRQDPGSDLSHETPSPPDHQDRPPLHPVCGPRIRGRAWVRADVISGPELISVGSWRQWGCLQPGDGLPVVLAVMSATGNQAVPLPCLVLSSEWEAFLGARGGEGDLEKA